MLHLLEEILLLALIHMQRAVLSLCESCHWLQKLIISFINKLMESGICNGIKVLVPVWVEV